MNYLGRMLRFKYVVHVAQVPREEKRFLVSFNLLSIVGLGIILINSQSQLRADLRVVYQKFQNELRVDIRNSHSEFRAEIRQLMGESHARLLALEVERGIREAKQKISEKAFP